MKGKFITFEGPEGSGKSTHSGLLCRWLKEKGFDVVHTREPGGTAMGEKIRRLLLDSKDEISPMTEMLLYQAARAKLVEDVIEPALKSGSLVVCDRFLDATVAYQGYGGGLSLSLIDAVGRLATKGIKPDLTILLDIETQKGLRRSVRDGADRMERKSLNYHRKVRRGYLAMARKRPDRIKLIKQNEDKDKTQMLIRKEVTRCLGMT